MSAPASRVSVVIPSYNHASWVRSAVESAIRQTLPPSEIVVVDDGSTDGTVEILRGFGSRIRLFERPHLGIGAGYNFGIAQASGDILAFLESDDAWEPTYLEETVGLLERRPEIAWVSTARRVVDDQGIPTGELLGKRTPGDRFTLAGMLAGDLGSTSTPVVRKQSLLEVGPYATGTYAADTDMALRFALVHGMAFVDRPVYRYRRHARNASKSLLANVRENIRSLERLQAEHASALRGMEGPLRRCLARYHGTVGVMLLEADPGARRGDIAPWLARAVRLHPTSVKHLRRYLSLLLLGPRLYGAWRRR